MDSLTEYLVKDILEVEEKNKTIAVYGGGFKPVTFGHFNVVKKALEQNPDIDKFIIFVGNKERDGITQDQSISIWNIYKKYLSPKIEIHKSQSPITSIYDYSKEHPEKNIIWVLGTREGKDQDVEDVKKRTKSLDKYPNLQPQIIHTTEDVSGTKARKALEISEEEFAKFIPNEIKEKEEIYYILKPEKVVSQTVNELENNEIKYWALYSNIYNALKKSPQKIYDKLKDKLKGEQQNALEYFYHTYFKEDQPILKEKKQNDPFGINAYALELAKGLEEDIIKENEPNNIKSGDFKKHLLSLVKYMLDQGMNIKPLPKTIIINDDVMNAHYILGKTAYYNPNDCTITLYTLNRHPKDILRSFSHEMIHREQDNNGRLNNVNTTNTNEDSNLEELEKEAYLKGNILFRNWEDNIKNK